MKKKLAIVLAMIMIMVCFTACGGNGGSGAPAGSASAEAETAATEGKVLKAGATSGFFGAESLDVANGWDGWIMSIYGISENLFRLDSDYVPQPYLAESYEQIDDNTWEFVIKDGIKFSNGNDVTADAVKACFERTYSVNERAEATLAIESMEADGQKLTIKTKTPDPTMLNDLCDPLLGVYDASQEADPELGVACTGPFVATAFTAMDHVSLTKNADYWQGEPKLDGVELSIIDDQNTLTMALQNGDIDMIARLDASAANLFTDESEYTIDSAITSRSAFLLYNLEHAGINDLAVREAIGYCIDRENFANVIYGGYAEPSYGVYSTALPFGGTEGLTPTVDKYDPAQAAQILKDAGYEDTNGDGTLDKDGNELSFKLITYSYNTETLQLADTLQSELGKVGIGITTEPLDTLVDTEKASDFDIAIDSYAMAPIGTPQYFTNLVFTTDASDNFGKYSNPEVDELAEKMGATFDVNEQYDYARQIDQIILNDRPFDFVGSTNLIFVYKNYGSGVTVNPSEYYLVTYDMDVEK